ncbi:MAG: type II toxin-antitoxin system RatA family toxin [Gammaproteobacteria bacterium]|nr:type II toxin-antitoxin system RatA family toxin [Gammaproteobacteria bacterium]
MDSVRKIAVVPYTAEEMYALVNDVEAYPDFLPWCSAAQVHAQNGNRVTASVSLSTAGIRQTFSTENTFQPGRRIDMRLLSGPFSRLEGYWKFDPAGDRACQVQFALDFEFRNVVLKLALSRVFHFIVNSLVDAFTRRAEQIYGTRRTGTD